VSPLVVGIDATRNRSGGAIAHALGILRDSDPTAHGLSRVHLWSYRTLLDVIPDAPWLVKHHPPDVERGLARQLWWQYRNLPREATAAGCHVLLNTDAGTICPFHPCVTMSRDMLSYEGQERRRYGWSRARLRLEVLRHVQVRSLRQADGAIFLTEYAARIIQAVSGPLSCWTVIPHGLGDNFRRVGMPAAWDDTHRSVQLLYVSNVAFYKHQWHVVRAVGMLRERGHDVHLVLAGDDRSRARPLLDAELARTDPGGRFVSRTGAVPYDEIPRLLARADVFVFASSCENMPNTLIEAMAAGLPIACANRGPMPEVLQDAGVFFDPESPETIATALERIILDRPLRLRIAARARVLSAQYSWTRCGDETWAFLRRVAQ
jgi:glycosyltransferase involved in cell wall biosynthesis